MMIKSFIISIFAILICSSSFAQPPRLEILYETIQEMNFGEFHKKGYDQGYITINPQSPSNSSYSGVEFDNISTIKPYSVTIRKTGNNSITIYFQKGGAGFSLNSSNPEGHNLQTQSNSYVIYAEGDGLDHYNQNYLTFKRGSGYVTIKVGATLSIPADPAEAPYTAYGQYLFTYRR